MPTRLHAFAHVLLLALAFAAPVAHAADDYPTADVKGSADHPVISRFAGSLLVGYAQQDWAAVELPGVNGISKADHHKWADPVQAEGKVTRLFYLAPAGKTPLEVFLYDPETRFRIQMKSNKFQVAVNADLINELRALGVDKYEAVKK
jgi:hypothetical protein